MKNRLVLVAAEEPTLSHHLVELLSEWGYEVISVVSVDEALGEMAQRRFVLSLLDLGSQASDLLRRLKTQGGAPGTIILLTDSDTRESPAESAALGADDFLQKPFSAEDLENVIKSALARPRRSWDRSPDDDSRVRLREEIGLWRSPRMSDVREIIEQAARVDVTVLIMGETGTGKDVVARAIHEQSVRQSGPFVKVNCAAVPRELLESELFGHERGAFTGAHQLKIGKFESADRGTIFLDEIGDLHPALQGKLLHVLQDGQFSRVGGRSTVKVDVRVLAATNQDLEQAVAGGRFREDLYYRLNVVPVRIPPLRERREDIPALAQHFLKRHAGRYRKPVHGFDAGGMQSLLEHSWPGNIRELDHAVERSVLLAQGELVRAGDLGLRASAPGMTPRIEDLTLEEVEKLVIQKALTRFDGNVSQAAKALGLSRSALYRRLETHEI
jgi:DNA-binding NtrC family response regulator